MHAAFTYKARLHKVLCIVAYDVANAVRPYRVLGKYFVISPLILHARCGNLFAYKRPAAWKVRFFALFLFAIFVLTGVAEPRSPLSIIHHWFSIIKGYRF